MNMLLRNILLRNMLLRNILPGNMLLRNILPRNMLLRNILPGNMLLMIQTVLLASKSIHATCHRHHQLPSLENAQCFFQRVATLLLPVWQFLVGRTNLPLHAACLPCKKSKPYIHIYVDKTRTKKFQTNFVGALFP